MPEKDAEFQTEHDKQVKELIRRTVPAKNDLLFTKPNHQQEKEKEEASARYHRHTDACRSCCEPFALCLEGQRLLRASVDAGNL